MDSHENATYGEPENNQFGPSNFLAFGAKII
jgi:hypothetical protein